MSALIPTSNVSVTSVANVADATVLPCRGGVMGMVGVPAGSLVTSLKFYAQVIAGGSFLPVHDSSGAVISITVTAGKAFALPSTIFGGYALKIVAGTFSSGTVTETNFEVAISTRIQ